MKVGEGIEMIDKMYKLGDKVRVTKLYESDRTVGIEEGDVLEVVRINDISGDLEVEFGGAVWYLTEEQVELVREEGVEDWSLRDEFAVMALNGLLSNSGGVVQSNSMGGTGYINGDAEGVAKWAYELADAMLKERSK